jgi:hypothetical protein
MNKEDVHSRIITALKKTSSRPCMQEHHTEFGAGLVDPSYELEQLTSVSHRLYHKLYPGLLQTDQVDGVVV